MGPGQRGIFGSARTSKLRKLLKKAQSRGQACMEARSFSESSLAFVVCVCPWHWPFSSGSPPGPSLCQDSATRWLGQTHVVSEFVGMSAIKLLCGVARREEGAEGSRFHPGSELLSACWALEESAGWMMGRWRAGEGELEAA